MREIDFDLVNKLSRTQERILNELKVRDVKMTAELLGMTEGSINVTLWRIRRKYKEARAFVNLIDSWRMSNPNLRKYLKTRETQ